MRLCLQEQAYLAEPLTHAAMVRFLDTYHEVSIPPTSEFVRSYLEKYKEKLVVVRSNSDLRLLEERIMAI